MRNARNMGVSLKARLGFGAALLGIGTCATALILWFGMQAVSDRLATALAAEARISRYSTLSQQTATFLVVATEAVQTGLPREERLTRIAPIVDQLRATFVQLQSDVGKAVEAAAELGLNAQSRYATQSLGLARMEALLSSTLTGLEMDSTDRARLRAYIDTFSSGFDPLLSQAVNTEVLFRNQTLNGIADLRDSLSRLALLIVALTLLAVALFYLALIRPQFRRLDRLRLAAQQIERADFAVDLPKTGRDEIGQLYQETNRMARSLLARQREVEAEWARLNETIAERTEALRAANASLEEIDENRRRFFADVSHELRTPLTVILMEAQLGLKETGNEAFSTIETRATRLNRRIDDLLRVARSDSGQLVLDTQTHALSEILQAVESEVKAETDNAGLRLVVTRTEDADLLCDANWIRQVLVSLVRNALTHARSGGMLEISTEHLPALVKVHVTDNGPGISEIDQAGIFERFRQGAGGTAQGFGIGLALVRWVVEEHGGEVRITSPVPREMALGDAPGTRLSITLPRMGTPR